MEPILHFHQDVFLITFLNDIKPTGQGGEKVKNVIRKDEEK